MTANRRSKRVIRSRMAQTGEKYTQARRALLAQGDQGTGAGEDPGVLLAWPDEMVAWFADHAYNTIAWPRDSLGWFTDQAHNAILLADDEARMLGHPGVGPEHLLLAAARYGNVERLLAREGIGARAIHDVIAQLKGFGDKLELRPRWHIPPVPAARPRYPRATGIFTPQARRVVAEDVLIVAERLGHRALTTGHVLLAILEHRGELISEIISPIPDIREVTAAVAGALPGEEDT